MGEIMKQLFMILQILLVFISCGENPTTNNADENLFQTFEHDSLTVEDLEMLIVGNWEWEYSIIMSRGLHPPNNIIKPETAGYTMQRNFESNGQVVYLKDNQRTATYTYEIRKFKILPTDKGYVTEIRINGHPARLLFFSPDSMMIGNGWSDGIDEYFVRGI